MPGSHPYSQEPLLTAQNSQNSDSDRVGSVAIIAIHGVGRHEPGASAEAIATLLSSLGRKDRAADYAGSQPPYAGFDEHSIEVPLERVATEFRASASGAKSTSGKILSAANDHHQYNFWQKFWGVFNERRGFLADPQNPGPKVPGGSAKSASALPAASKHDSEDFGYLYMLEQLADYEGDPEREFSTFRFDSRPSQGRIPSVSDAPGVHIYDAHYSDLSKPENSFTGFFFAFYQLLFHLAGLGLNGVYLAERENSDGATFWPWRAFSWSHATAVRLLTMFIPILNLVVLAIGLCAFADKLSARDAGILGYTMAGVLGFAATLVVRKYHKSPSRPILWALIPFVGAIAVTAILAGLGWAADKWPTPMGREKWMVVLIWLLLAGGVIYWIAKKFGEVRAGADKIAIPLYAFNTLIFLFIFLRQASAAVHHETATAALLTIQLVLGEIAFCWTLCLVTAFISWPVSEICLTELKDAGQKCRARAAHRTGRFTFAVSASVFLITTMILWSGVAHYTSKEFHVFDQVPVQLIEERSFAHGAVAHVMPNVDRMESVYWCTELPRGAVCPPQNVSPSDTEHPWDHYLDLLVMVTVTPGLPITLLLIAISFLLLVWAAMPSVLLEIWPKRTPPSGKEVTVRAGEWLSRGLDNVVILIRVLWLAIVPVPLVFGLLNLLSWSIRLPEPLYWVLDALRRLTLPMIQGLGALVAVSAVAIVTLIFKYGVVILDALLDVDNYLRTVPVEQTPRARIAERCTSLLRVIAAHRDSAGRPYQRLIIVAHSLGTLVMGDLLRFLALSKIRPGDPVLSSDGLHADAEAPAIPIYFFTMGSPLRPLLSRFFPHLYEWVASVPDNSCRESRQINAIKAPEGIPATERPNPEELCVKGWCNAYRSGDYVGRYLWSAGWLQRNEALDGDGRVVRINDASPARRAEMCIGIGAHTHYWDRNAKDVAESLQDLIVNPGRIFP
jgi:hypothetical protein